MNAPISEAFNDVIREKRIDKSLLMETLTAGFSSAAKKKFGASAEVEVTEDKQGNLTLYLLKTVVSEVESPANEITKAEAKEYDKKVKVGDTVKINVPFTDFGRNAIQIAKQILMQKIREFERDRTFDEYEDRVGEIVSGSVQQIDRNGILINLGNAEATMPKKEQIRRERYNQGASIRACIVKVDKEAKGPMITLSRTSADFLKKLFSQEVPEIYEGIIEIKNIAREAGGRSKIAVYSRDDRVDAVGACVGMKGSRVQAVVNELSGERIDIVPWNEDITAFVSRALSPAKISGVRVDSEEQRVLVIVDEDQLSLAIGKDGQNVRLGSKLTGWQIDLITSRELEQRERLQEHLTMGIEEMAGVSVRVAEKLRAAGITTVQKFSKTPLEELLEIPGFGPKTVEKLQETAQATIEELDKALRELIAKEEEERAKEKETEKPLFDESILNEEGTPEEAPALTEEALFSKSSEDSEPTGAGAAVAEVTEEETVAEGSEEEVAVEEAEQAVAEGSEKEVVVEEAEQAVVVEEAEQTVAEESEEEVAVEEAEQAVAEESEEAKAVEDAGEVDAAAAAEAAVDDVAAETESDETEVDTEKNPS